MGEVTWAVGARPWCSRSPFRHSLTPSGLAFLWITRLVDHHHYSLGIIVESVGPAYLQVCILLYMFLSLVIRVLPIAPTLSTFRMFLHTATPIVIVRVVLIIL